MLVACPPISSNGNESRDGAVYADCVNHCRRWRDALVRGSRVSSAHEMTHFINADARNKQGVGYTTTFTRSFAASHESVDGASLESLPQPVPIKSDGKTAFQKVNCLYFLDSKVFVLPEPGIRKSEVGGLIPRELRSYRYSTYVAGQTAWDDMPLYLWDEWIAYVNGAKCAADLLARGLYDEGQRDILMGVLEFVVYGTGVMMRSLEKDPSVHDQLLPYFSAILSDSIMLFHKQCQNFLWSSQEGYFEAIASGAAGKPLRDYYKKVGCKIPGPKSRPRHSF